jgi:hypothetical protein
MSWPIQGDSDSLLRLNDLYGHSLSCDELRSLVQNRLSLLPVAAGRTADFALADAQLLIARECGFESWAKLVESAAHAPDDSRSAPLGLSSKPPFYRIDWQDNTIEPGGGAGIRLSHPRSRPQ